VDPNNEDVLVAGGLHFWRSIDGGINWRKITHSKSDSAGYVHVDQHEVTFLNSDTVFFGNDGGIWKCSNFRDDTPMITNRNATYNVTQYYAGAIHPDAGSHIVIGGTQDNGSGIAISSGKSDFQKLSGADGAFCAINYNDGNIMYTTTQYLRMYRFVNGGSGGYDAITNPYLKGGSSSSGGNTLFINPMEMDPIDPDIIYQASNNGIWRLKNASAADDSDWEQATKAWGTVSAIGISQNPANILYFGRQSSSGKVFRVVDAHLTTSSYRPENTDPADRLPQANMGEPDFFASCIYVDPQDGGHVIVVYSNYGAPSIFESKDAADPSPTWHSVEGDLPDIPVRWALLHPLKAGVCYIATEIGVFYTNNLDGDSTIWLPANQGLAYVRTDMLRIRKSDHSILAATHGRGLYVGRIQSDNSIIWEERGPSNIGGRTRTIMVDPNDATGNTVWAGSVSGGLWKTSSIDSLGYFEPDPEVLPSSLAVSIYPNPSFSNGVTFEIALHEEREIGIQIYDISGRLVKDFTPFTKGAGFHMITWQPEPFIARGIYFVSLLAGDHKTTRKIVFMPH